MKSANAPIVACAVADIVVPTRLRELNEDEIPGIMESISTIGLQTPIQVRRDGDNFVLIAGLHRLEAHKRLDVAMIDAQIIACSPDEARLREIAENLHRAALTALERSDHIAEWIRLTQEDEPGTEKASPLETVCKGGRGRTGGIRAAARELKIDKSTAHRAMAVASLSDKAKTAARDANMDDNRKALLTAAQEPTPDAQVAKIRELAEMAKSRAKRGKRQSETVEDHHDIKCSDVANASDEPIAAVPEQQDIADPSKTSTDAPTGQSQMAFALFADIVRSLTPQQTMTIRDLAKHVDHDNSVFQSLLAATKAMVAGDDDDIERILADMQVRRVDPSHSGEVMRPRVVDRAH